MLSLSAIAVPRPRAPEPEFLIRDFEPAYLALHRTGELLRRVEAGLRELEDCCACPRNCHVNRLQDHAKVCGTGRHAIVSSAFPHFGEENCLRGWNGSGTIFFGLCNLRCVFCQNWDISQQKSGAECTAEQIADLMLALQVRGCHNINFVTPEHVVPQVIEAVAAAVPRGLNLPIVYNTSAYDSVESLRLLDGIVDIYMPDFKFWERDSARQYVKAKDYPDRAREAIFEMHRQVGPLKLNEEGLARRGLLVRHLVMPGQTAEAAAIFQWLADEVSPDTYVNIMDQYRPEYSVAEEGTGGKYTAIARRPRAQELTGVRRLALEAGLWRLDER
ncbi:MAG: radical SAM protein [Gammaproteobacteria bacterium]|nr:radical SAM protein [Gammaproteobacteria bacterium]